jgi:Uma2 family endonuclease
VAEVLPPATARRDLGEKLRLYAEAVVAEYWIVDPALQSFEFLVRSNEGFRRRLPDGPFYRSTAIPGLEIDLEAFRRSISIL